jgi:hypothetical protein
MKSFHVTDNLREEENMKKEGFFMKMSGGSLAVAALIALAGVGTAGAAPDMGMTGMMTEGITYESAAAPKSFVVKHDNNRADMTADMSEGIVYADSVVAGDAVLIKLNHRQAMLRGMEACLCEDPSASVAAR